MNNPLRNPPDPASLPNRVTARFWVAHWAIALENAAYAFFPFIGWLVIFIILALFGWSGNLFAGVFWLGCLATLVIGYRKFRLPSHAIVAERLEKSSNLSHRPLRSHDDIPAQTLTDETALLWSHEKNRRRKDLRRLRWIVPSVSLTAHDPFAIRIAVILLLLIGAIIAGTGGFDRVKSGLFPFASSLTMTEGSSSTIKIVITPPSYTRKPQIILTERPPEKIVVPQGSLARILVQSRLGHLSFEAGATAVALKQDGDTDAYMGEGIIRETDSLQITQFGLPRLTVAIIFEPDRPPRIKLREQPVVIAGGQLRLPLTVEDDYGLRLVRVRAILSPRVKTSPLGQPVFEEQAIIMSMAGKPVDINPTFDLTGHPWAGYDVTLLIEGEDHAGQTASVEPLDMVLPERPFRHPVAREIAAARGNLIRLGERAALPVALQLEQIISRPGRYSWDIVTVLALRSAAGRLEYAPGLPSVMDAIANLWPTALRLEDGSLTTTQKDVRQALQALQKAVQDKKSPEEIARLMQDFREALMAHMSALQKQMNKNMQAGEMMPIPPDMMAQTIDASMLNEFLSQLENEMINGDTEAAMKKLENLQKMSDMLNPAMAQGLPQDMKDQMKNLKDLQKLIDRQQALLDETRAKTDKSVQKEKQEQSAIHKDLGETVPAAKAPPELTQAGDAMLKSQDRLAAGEPQQAVPHQQQALDHLREGRQSMQESLKQRMQQMMGISMGPSMPGQGDPLGRGSPSKGRNIFEEGTRIPTGSDRKKADEILKTIRERAGDLARPQSEREYYQRLLRQW